jgi:hypothetical protein
VTLTVLAKGEQTYIADLEIAAIKVFRTALPDGYNMAPGGFTGPGKEAMLKRSETLKQSGVMKRVAIERWNNPAEREKLLVANRRPECRKAKAWKRGLKDSDETRTRKSAAMTGKKKAAEHCRNIGLAKRGTVYITDGTVSRRVRPPVDLPQGWRFGMAPKNLSGV